jgi:hypothetical protein
MSGNVTLAAASRVGFYYMIGVQTFLVEDTDAPTTLVSPFSLWSAETLIAAEYSDVTLWLTVKSSLRRETREAPTCLLPVEACGL